MPLSLFHLHGDLQDLRFPRLLASLCEDRFTGVFQVTTPGSEADEVTREIHFQEGHVAWAISTDRQEGLRAFLARDGIITDAQWAEAEERSREATLRQTLMDMGLVTSRQLAQVEKGRAEEIIMELFAALAGEYRVRERQLPPGTPDLQIEVRPLLLRGMLERADRGVILQEVGSLDSVFVPKRTAGEAGAALPGEFQSILRHADGRATIADICSATSLPDYFVCSAVAALSLTGHLKRAAEKPKAPSPAVVTSRNEDEIQQTAPMPSEVPVTVPAISARPFAGDGALSFPEGSPSEDDEYDEPLETMEEVDSQPAAETLDESFADSVALDEAPQDAIVLMEDDAPEQDDPRPEAPPKSAAIPLDSAPSVYGVASQGAGSRPWFLLGGATAVGVAALSLILMTQGQGGAVELGRTGGSEVPSSMTGADIGDDPDIADKPAIAPPAPPASAAREAIPRLEAPEKPSILSQGSGSDPSQRGRVSLATGDYPAAARYFGRATATRGGDYTIQLLMACREDTLRRTVDSAGGAPDLFILAASHAGQECYRVFWGSYPSKTRAAEALRRDVPVSLRADRDPPRIKRLGDL